MAGYIQYINGQNELNNFPVKYRSVRNKISYALYDLMFESFAVLMTYCNRDVKYRQSKPMGMLDIKLVMLTIIIKVRPIIFPNLTVVAFGLSTRVSFAPVNKSQSVPDVPSLLFLDHSE